MVQWKMLTNCLRICWVLSVANIPLSTSEVTLCWQGVTETSTAVQRPQRPAGRRIGFILSTALTVCHITGFNVWVVHPIDPYVIGLGLVPVTGGDHEEVGIRSWLRVTAREELHH